MPEARVTQFSIPDLDQPDRWDRRLNTSDRLKELTPELQGHRTTLHSRRLLQVVLATGNVTDIRNTVTELRKHGIRELEGVYARALCQTRQYNEVLSAPRAAGMGASPLELENVLDDQQALAQAYAQLKNYERAELHLHTVQLLARALNMHYRLQWSLIEGGRIAMLRGQPKSEQIADARMMLPMSARRNAWSAQSLAESQMAEGDYYSAWLTVENMKFDDVDDLPLFLAAVLNLEKYEVAAHDSASQGDYAPLARAIWALRRGKTVDMRSLGFPAHEPLIGYVDAINALVVHRDSEGPLAKRGRAHLESLLQKDPLPDVRFLLQHTLSGAIIEQGEQGAYAAYSALHQALLDLPYPSALLELLRDIEPSRTAVLIYSPVQIPHLYETMLRIEGMQTLLTGEFLRLRGQSVKLPGKVHGSRQLVLACYRREAPAVASRTVRQIRLTLQAAKTFQYVNLGSVIRAYVLLAQQAPPTHKAVWANAAYSVCNLLDSTTLRNELIWAVSTASGQPNIHVKGGVYPL